MIGQVRKDKYYRAIDELICGECGRRVGLWNYSGELSTVCDVG